MSTPEILTPTPTQVGEFKVQPSLMFIDESGHFPPRPGDVSVLAGLVIPKHLTPLRVLSDLVQTLRARVDSRPKPPSTRKKPKKEKKGEVKGYYLIEDDYNLIGDTIRAQEWAVGHQALNVEDSTSGLFRDVFRQMKQAFVDKRKDLDPFKRLDLRLDMFERQFDQASEQQAIYLALLFKLFLHTAAWFRSYKWLPTMQVYLDDKLPRASQELLNFHLRFPFFTTFGEFFELRLGALMGVDPAPAYQCHVSSDDDQDGLVIADAIAYAASRMERNDDPTGMYQRALDRMSIEKSGPLPPIAS